MLPSPVSASWPTARTKAWKSSFRATKSVSELTSTTAPVAPRVLTPTSPSAATRLAFLAAAASPFLRSQSTAPSMSPLVWPSACLQSIIPAPVFSRNSLTSAAVISAIASILSQCISFAGGLFVGQGPPRGSLRGRLRLFRLLRRGLCRHRGLVAGRLFRLLRQLFGRGLGAGADIDARCRHLGLQAIEHRLGDEVAIQMDRTHSIVVPGDRVGDAVGRGVRIEDRDDRDAQLIGLLYRDRLLVGVDHEQDVGQAAHLLDAAKGAFELVAVTGQRQQFALGQAGLFSRDPLL